MLWVLRVLRVLCCVESQAGIWMNGFTNMVAAHAARVTRTATLDNGCAEQNRQSPLPHLHRDRGSPLPHLHRDWVGGIEIAHRSELEPAHPCVGEPCWRGCARAVSIALVRAAVAVVDEEKYAWKINHGEDRSERLRDVNWYVKQSIHKYVKQR